MIKKDWSVTRITALLYVIVLFIPLNYYFVKHHFDDTQNDAKTMNHLVFIGSTLPSLEKMNNLK